MNKKRLIFWVTGFVVLFLINVLVEAIVLPVMGLDNTPKNDIYFQVWWIIVGLWLLFGLSILKFTERKPG